MLRSEAPSGPSTLPTTVSTIEPAPELPPPPPPSHTPEEEAQKFARCVGCIQTSRLRMMLWLRFGRRWRSGHGPRGLSGGRGNGALYSTPACVTQRRCISHALMVSSPTPTSPQATNAICWMLYRIATCWLKLVAVPPCELYALCESDNHEHEFTNLYRILPKDNHTIYMYPRLVSAASAVSFGAATAVRLDAASAVSLDAPSAVRFDAAPAFLMDGCDSPYVRVLPVSVPHSCRARRRPTPSRGMADQPRGPPLREPLRRLSGQPRGDRQPPLRNTAKRFTKS